MMYGQKGFFSGILCFGKLHTGILISIFTLNLAYGWMDKTDDGHTEGQMEFQMESHFGWQTDESCN